MAATWGDQCCYSRRCCSCGDSLTTTCSSSRSPCFLSGSSPRRRRQRHDLRQPLSMYRLRCLLSEGPGAHRARRRGPDRYSLASNIRPRPIRLAFVVTELMVGGAELMLWKLLSRIDRDQYDPVIYALSSRTDQILHLFDAIGVPYHLLGIAPNARAVGGFVRLARKLKETQPDLIQGWLPHGNIAATISRFISR